MRTTIKLTFAALAVAGVAGCGDARATDAAQEDLKRDLQLASSATMNLVAPPVDSALLTSMESKPNGAPAPATVVKRGAGTRAVRSHTPTVRATPVVEVAALDASNEVMSESEAPAPENAEPVAVAPRPAPPAGDYGTGINGGGVGAGGGSGGSGVVIRGGGVDGDNCDLHRRRPGGVFGGGGGYGGPIYIPQPRTQNTGGIFIGERIGSTGRMTPQAPTRRVETVRAPRSTGNSPRPSGGGFSRSRIGR